MPHFATPHIFERLYIRLWWVHHWQLPGDWTWEGPPSRPFTTVWYVLDGSIEAVQDDVHFVLGPHELAIVPPGSRLRSWSRDPRGLEFLSLGCEIRLDEVDLFLGRPLIHQHQQLPQSVLNLWTGMVASATAYESEREPLDGLALSGLVRMWWAQLCRSARIRLDQHPEPHPCIPKALQFIRSNLDRPLTTTDVAQHVHLSVGYLRELFRTELGKPLTTVLREVRFAHAKMLLLSSELSITEIAYKVGYSDVHHFSRAFSRAEHVPPSAYRARFESSGI